MKLIYRAMELEEFKDNSKDEIIRVCCPEFKFGLKQYPPIEECCDNYDIETCTRCWSRDYHDGGYLLNHELPIVINTKDYLPNYICGESINSIKEPILPQKRDFILTEEIIHKTIDAIKSATELASEVSKIQPIPKPKDNFIISIESVQGTYREIADRARTTIGLDNGNKEISNSYMRRMYMSEHSPIRIRSFIIKIKNVPSWLATHFVRHHNGYTPYVSTQRDDRNNEIEDRDSTPQGNLVTLEIHANTQAIINVSKKRLCNSAHERARDLWNQVLQEIRKIDEPLYRVCVRECVYRGFCPEFKMCKQQYSKTKKYQEELLKYREGINNETSQDS